MITGTHPTLLDVKYFRRDQRTARPECFQVTWIDDNGKVRCTEESPDVDFWIVKKEFRNFSYNKPHEKMSNMDKVRVPYSRIPYVIAKESGAWGENILRIAMETKDFKYRDELYRWPYCFGADFQPEFYFMKEWYEKYPLQVPNLTKAYLDIEVDQIDVLMNPSSPETTADAPINLITIQIEEDRESYTFMLKPYKPIRTTQNDREWMQRLRYYEKQKQDYERLVSDLPRFYARCNSEFDKVYGHINYQLRCYEREIDLIADAFRLLEKKRPNFCLIYNMRFDIPTILARCERLGYDPKSIMCSPEIKYPRCYFMRDKSTWDPKKQTDVFELSSFTKFVCQYRNYRSIRKSQHEMKQAGLNYVMEQVLGDHKVQYAEESNIRTFAYIDLERFVMYNIKDTLGQMGVERVLNDIRTWYMRAHQNLTPYSKIFRESLLIRNVRERFFEDQGLVQCNNINLLNLRKEAREARMRLSDGFDYDEMLEAAAEEEIESTFKGAIVADPMMNMKVGQEIMGRPTNILYPLVIDFDMSSFYPSIKIACNIDSSTLIFKITFINQEFISGKYMNRSLNQTYFEKDKNGKTRELELVGESINMYLTGNILEFGHCWLGLPSIAEVERMLEPMMEVA